MVFQRFSCRDVPPRQRALAIEEAYGPIANVRVACLGEAPPFVETSLWQLPHLTIARTSCSPCHVSRLHPQLGDGNDDLVLCIVTRGSVRIRTRTGEEILCEAGDVYLGPNDLPAQRTFHEPASFFDLAIPRPIVRPAVADPGAAFVQAKIASTAPGLRLLAGYVHILTQDQQPVPVEVAASAAAHVHDLVVTALGATRDASQLARNRGVRAARLRILKADVAANLTSGDLTLDALAARHGISPQYVRALFHAEGTTFTDFVRNERLKHAYRRLTDPRFAAWSISAIALESGFNDLSYFNRTFRRRYGMTPSQVRAVLRPAAQRAEQV